MRKLTIKRRKKILACAMKVFIYLETKVDEDKVLDGIPCKLKGFIKNGKSLTIDVPDESVTVFVCYDKFAPNRFKVGYTLPPGTEDLTISTYPKYSPFQGNPFVIVD